MIKFQAAILTQLNQPLTIGTVELDEDNLEIGQVLVSVITSGLCGAQLQEIAGLKGNANFLPHLLGHEGCGIVEKIGPGVTTCKMGDKVILHWRKGSGIEAPFPRYRFNGAQMTSGKVTTLSEYSIVSENRLTVVDRRVDPDLCTLLGCGLSTALGVVNKVADVKIGESVLVLGCGGVGTSIIKACAMVSAGFILGIDRSPSSQNITMLSSQVYFREDASQLMAMGKEFDCIIDTTGSMDLVSEALPYLSERGRVILVSQPAVGSRVTVMQPARLFLGDGQSIRATQGGSVDPTTDFPRYISILERNSSWCQLITESVGLSKVNDAIANLRNGIGGRTIINPLL